METPEVQAIGQNGNTQEVTPAERFIKVRSYTEHLCDPLVPEDCVIQTMEDVSPTKWHLAHTTWFFETFVLRECDDGYEPFDERFAYLFNSYYVQAGDRHCRPKRGLLSRPTVDEVYEYRGYVDRHMQELLMASDALDPELKRRVELGLNHEQQHQELILTDVKHVLSENPLHPVYKEGQPVGHSALPPEMQWIEFDGGLYEIGYTGDGFHYDNEKPVHKYYLEPFVVGSRLVTNREFLEFIEDDGYNRQEIWLSEGWAAREKQGWRAPGYWESVDGRWFSFTLRGFRPVNLDEPVSHVSYYEADAYSRWAGARLLNEFEWEVASATVPVQGNFVEQENFHPIPISSRGGELAQMFGDVWEWTRSQYSPYPGYNPEPGALGEYNGKFMCNQFVLRGGSVATSSTHIRRTYRNFFYPGARWQFTGVRLAKL